MLFSHRILKLNYSKYFSTIAKHFEGHSIVKDVVDKAPSKLVNIIYPDGISLYPGCILTPTEVQNEPLVAWDGDNKNYHTICLIDPDVPCRSKPQFREWQHWLVVNIPGCRQHLGDIKSAYIGAGPPKGTGLHRYVFLVYKQPGRIDFSGLMNLGNNSGTGRANFSIRKFAAQYKLGNPIAGNFFQAEWDDYVPVLYKRLGL